jgi:hypothetical protein
MNEWQPIETAPTEILIDLWAKRWIAKTDEFAFKRFADCYLDFHGKICGLDPDYRATHWMPLPEPPK